MVKIRSLEVADVKQAMHLVLSEGWNQTLQDWKFMIQNSPDICLAAEVDNMVVGTSTAVIYSGELAWIGMVLVDKNYRGKGISKKLLERLFKETDSYPGIKLDATPAGRPVYQKFGFADECQLVRMVNFSVQSLQKEENAEVQRIRQTDISSVTEFDRHVFGTGRENLIRFLFNNSEETAWMIKTGHRLNGFLLGRKGNKYFQVGPVAAETDEHAIALMQNSLQQLSRQAVVVDVPVGQIRLIEWLIATGFTKQRIFTRMYRHKNLFPGKKHLQYLIAGPEFG